MNIVLGVTGSISAYKAPWLVRDLRRAGHDVRVVMTSSASRFVSPLALQAVSLHDVIVDAFDTSIQHGGSWHVHLAHWTQLMLIAPCSATTLARLTTGLTDSAVNLVASSLPKGTPLVVAPAMDSDMWTQPSTQRNIAQLKSDGVVVIAPESGELASGLIGEGRLPELHKIVDIVQEHASAHAQLTHAQVTHAHVTDAQVTDAHVTHAQTTDERTDGPTAEFRDGQAGKGPLSLRGKHIVITAGPTHEAIDDVRFVANASSGRMGYALAEAARDRGATVTLVSGPVGLPQPLGIETLNVVSAADMHHAVMQQQHVDVYIMSAAVADFTPETIVAGKLKKEHLGDSPLTITFTRTNDILADVGLHKKSGQIVVGFALETTDVLTNAKDKLIRKNADMIVANQAGVPRSGFGSPDNTITILTPNAEPVAYPSMSKRACAEVILDAIEHVHAGERAMNGGVK